MLTPHLYVPRPTICTVHSNGATCKATFRVRQTFYEPPEWKQQTLHTTASSSNEGTLLWQKTVISKTAVWGRFDKEERSQNYIGYFEKSILRKPESDEVIVGNEDFKPSEQKSLHIYVAATTNFAYGTYSNISTLPGNSWLYPAPISPARSCEVSVAHLLQAA